MTSPQSTDRQTGRDERSGAGHCWIYRDSFHYPRVSFTKPDPAVYPFAIEYMRVLSRQEVEKLLNSDEGCDTQQYINSLCRTIAELRQHVEKSEMQKHVLTCEVERLRKVEDAVLSELRQPDSGSVAS